MVECLTVVLSSGPYQTERAFTALRLVLTALLEGLKINLFLVEDGVLIAKRGQKPNDFTNVEEMLGTAIKEGVKIVVCGICAKERGLDELDFLDDVKKGTMHDLVSWIKETDRTLFL